MYCPECGIKNPDNARFCVKCGADLRKAAPSNNIPKYSVQYSEVKQTKDINLFLIGISAVIIIALLGIGIWFGYTQLNKPKQPITVNVLPAVNPPQETKKVIPAKPDEGKYGVLLIGGLPTDVTVHIDGQLTGKAYSEGTVKIDKLIPGGHLIVCEAGGYKPYSKQVQINKGEQTALTVKLEPLDGVLSVQGSPAGANVYVDGNKAGQIPYKGTIQAGQHTIEITASGYSEQSKAVTITSDTTTSIEVALNIIPHPPPGMAYVPAGWFRMGCSPDDKHCLEGEKPYHRVYLDAYYIDKNDATVNEYARCVHAGGCTQAESGGTCNYGVPGRGDNPVNCVDWYQARAYCKWAAKQLPTEAQWENAARGTAGRIYPWENEWDCSKSCNSVSPCNHNHTCPAGSYSQDRSPYGVMDMAGNVFDWVSDWYGSNYYSTSPAHNPKGPANGDYKVLHGGSWYTNSPASVRSSYRFYLFPAYRYDFIGFRCVRGFK